MDEDQNGKDARMWRVGIVAPDCEPSFAIEPGTIRDEEVAAVAGKYSEMAPEGCFVFAFRSRSDSFDVRCAVLASLFAVHVGKGEYTACDLLTFYDDQFTSWKTQLAEQARTCIDLRGKLQDARRRVVAAIAAGLVIGALLGGAAAFLLFSEHAPFRVADDRRLSAASLGAAGPSPAAWRSMANWMSFMPAESSGTLTSCHPMDFEGGEVR